MRRWILLAGIALCVPLSGCVQDQPPPATLRAATAAYTWDNHTLEVTLRGPVDVLDRDGMRRPAYVIELDQGSFLPYSGIQAKDLYALDGDLRVVVDQRGCTMYGKQCYMGPVIDWGLQGALPPYGFLWPMAVETGATELRIDGVSLQVEVQRTMDHGMEVLTVQGPAGAPLYMAHGTRYTYDGSLFPLRVETRGQKDDDWTLWFERTALTEGVPLQPIPAWPRADPAPSGRPEPRLFPGDDLPVLDSEYSPAAMLDVLLRDSPEAKAQLATGCLIDFSYPYGGSGWAMFSPLGVNVTFDSHSEVGIGILDGDGKAHVWVLNEERSTLLGQETGHGLTVIGEDRDDYAARDDGTFTCADVAASPGPALTAQAFLEKAGSLRDPDSKAEMFLYSVRPPYRSSRPPAMGWGAYVVWSMPQGQEGGMLWPIEMDAANGWWTWVAIHDEGLQRLAAFPASA